MTLLMADSSQTMDLEIEPYRIRIPVIVMCWPSRSQNASSQAARLPLPCNGSRAVLSDRRRQPIGSGFPRTGQRKSAAAFRTSVTSPLKTSDSSCDQLVTSVDAIPPDPGRAVDGPAATVMAGRRAGSELGDAELVGVRGVRELGEGIGAGPVWDVRRVPEHPVDLIVGVDGAERPCARRPRSRTRAATV